MSKKILAYKLNSNQNTTNNMDNKSLNCEENLNSEDTHVPETQLVSLIARQGVWVEPTQSTSSSEDSITDIPHYIPV